jgi:hypothetical protein
VSDGDTITVLDASNQQHKIRLDAWHKLPADGALINIECKGSSGRFLAVLIVVYFASPRERGGFRGAFMRCGDALKR